MGKRFLNAWMCTGLAALSFLSVQCDGTKDARLKQLKQELKERYEVRLDDRIDKIYVINDYGCGNCILSLSEFVKKNVDDERSLILINSRGINVDLDAFEQRKKENPNIVITHQVETDPNETFSMAGAIYLKEEKIDTIVNIMTGDVLESLQYIANRSVE